MNRVDLGARQDFTLAHYAAVSRGGASVAVTAAAMRTIDASRAGFLAFLDAEPRPWIYNVSGRWIDGRPVVVAGAERAAMALRPIAAGAVLDGSDAARRLPERIVRGVVFCRLTNCIEGHAGLRAETVAAVAAMLDAPMPVVPVLGHGAAGEMLLLSHVFGAFIETRSLREKEASALVNGAPAAAALLADCTLSSGVLLVAVIECVAASIAAFGAPLAAYDPALQELWDNPVAGRVNALLRAAAAHLPQPAIPATMQAPVSYRAAPRLLTRAVETHARLRRGAERALRAVTDNPAIVCDPAVRTLANGGFFDADAPAAFDQMAGEWADLARLLERLATRLAEASAATSPPELQYRVRSLVSALTGYAEDAAAAATRTPLPGSDGGGAPQNDLLSPVLQAWNKCEAAAACVANAVAAVEAMLAPQRMPQSSALRHAMAGALALPAALESLYV